MKKIYLLLLPILLIVACKSKIQEHKAHACWYHVDDFAGAIDGNGLYSATCIHGNKIEIWNYGCTYNVGGYYFIITK